jgi:hypothetical protein
MIFFYFLLLCQQRATRSRESRRVGVDKTKSEKREVSFLIISELHRPEWEGFGCSSSLVKPSGD